MSDIVLIHGAWVAPSCWNSFKARYEAKGHSVIAPAWPHDDRPVSELRASPAPELARIGVQEIAAHYESIVRTYKQPPILIGHSFGGLIVQILLDRGLGSAGVALDPAPPRGVLPTLSAVRANLPVLFSWAGWRRTLRITPEGFTWAFVHQLPERERREAYEQHVIPTPGRPFFQAAFAPFISATKVRFDNHERAPLLITAGSSDRTVTAPMNRANHRKFSRSRAITEFREFPKRSHWLIAEPGWDEIADEVLEWAQTKSRDAATRPST